MKKQGQRVLGRTLAVEEMKTVAGGTTPFVDSIWTETGSPANGDETSPNMDTMTATDSHTAADSHTVSDTGATADSGTVADTGPTVDFSIPGQTN